MWQCDFWYGIEAQRGDIVAKCLISAEDAYLYNTGAYFHAYNSLGAHITKLRGLSGVGFVVWAPFALAVSVVGDWNDWRCGENPMERLSGGFWQCFVPGIAAGAKYKYAVQTADGGWQYKADPFAFAAERRPGTASRVADISGYCWHDGEWLAKRAADDHFERPLNIYELHLGSWRRKKTVCDGNMDVENPEGFLSYTELADELTDYVGRMGYTHVEFLPVMEHPLDDSWGYQTTGYFAATSRYGEPQQLMYLIDRLHMAGIGVILDWVPGHFCRDAQGLANFDGTALYESEEHAQWGTYKFNFGRSEVRSFLISSAFFWLDKYHVDGIRVDGVTSMLYLNFGRNGGKKRYNELGGEEDLAAVAFLRALNRAVGWHWPGVMMIAEESTAWPLVTRPPEEGGLGFHYKWDMGWMNDTLRYMELDFPCRRYEHRLLTFSLMYAFDENFIEALSHDEVVHGKKSLIGRMPGDYWRQFAGLRLLYLYQMTHSGAKLNFMGSEFGQFIEWRFAESLEWFLLDYPAHAKHQHFVEDLNHLYLRQKALWQQNYSRAGYRWLEADNAGQSVLLFVRQGKKPEDVLIVLLNFRPDTYTDYRIGVPFAGEYREIFNSDALEYGGSGKINAEILTAEDAGCHGEAYSLRVTVPPLGGMIWQPLLYNKQDCNRHDCNKQDCNRQDHNKHDYNEHDAAGQDVIRPNIINQNIINKHVVNQNMEPGRPGETEEGQYAGKNAE